MYRVPFVITIQYKHTAGRHIGRLAATGLPSGRFEVGLRMPMAQDLTNHVKMRLTGQRRDLVGMKEPRISRLNMIRARHAADRARGKHRRHTGHLVAVVVGAGKVFSGKDAKNAGQRNKHSSLLPGLPHRRVSEQLKGLDDAPPERPTDLRPCPESTRDVPGRQRREPRQWKPAATPCRSWNEGT